VAAAHSWHLGASGYGVALGAIGFGAVLAVAVPAPLRQKVSPNALLAAGAAVYGLAALAVAWLPFAAAMALVPIVIMAVYLSLARWVGAFEAM